MTWPPTSQGRWSLGKRFSTFTPAPVFSPRQRRRGAPGSRRSKAIPSALAYQTGQAMAESLLARHLADTGHYPQSVGLSVWGTSAMRTSAMSMERRRLATAFGS